MVARAEFDTPDRRGSWLDGLVRALVVAVAVLAVWQAVILVFAPPPFMLPPPSRVWRALVERPDLWRRDAVTTLIETVAGLFTGALAGIALALVMVFVPARRSSWRRSPSSSPSPPLSMTA